MKRQKSDKSSKRSSIAAKLSHFSFFSSRKTTKSVYCCEEASNETDGKIIANENEVPWTCIPTRRQFSRSRTVRFRDSTALSHLGEDIELYGNYCTSSPHESPNDPENLILDGDRRNNNRNRYQKKKNRFSLDLSQSFIRYRDHEAKNISPEKRARSLTRSQRTMHQRVLNQRRNTYATERRSPHQSPVRISSNGVVLRNNTPTTNGGNRRSIFQGSTESLSALIRNPENRRSFRAFLVKEYSEENLDFWVRCDEYRKVNPTQRRGEAMKIYETFLGDSASREINIDAGMRQRLKHNVTNPQEDTFDEAQKHIFELMEQGPFRRFPKLNG